MIGMMAAKRLQMLVKKAVKMKQLEEHVATT